MAATKPTIVLPQSNRVRLVVASSVMLTFISFWRAAAIVLNDLGSSAFYAGGLAEEAVGKAAPWFVLGVMIFSYAVRAVYVESCSMFTRGGVYRIVKEALGGTFAKVSVSALMFDYVLTGPISGVSAGQYIVGMVNDLAAYCAAKFHWAVIPHLRPDFSSAAIAIAITMYFWWQNTKGIEESSEKALNIMKVTTVMVVILLAWGIFTVVHRGAALPPLPIPLARMP
jgi:amino acid transporter